MPSRVPNWVYAFINEHSLGELQAGITYTDPTRKETPDAPWPYTIEPVTRRVSGTGIPAPVFHGIKTKGWVPGSKTIQKLRLMRNRFNYARLRASGASASEARRIYKSKDVESYIDGFRRVVEAIARAKNVDPNFIAHQMQKRDRMVEDWMYYTQEQKYEIESPGFFEEDEFYDDYLEEGDIY